MAALRSLQTFGLYFLGLITDPASVLLVFGAVVIGIVFGATPGLTATLGVALLTTLTYGMDHGTALEAPTTH